MCKAIRFESTNFAVFQNLQIAVLELVLCTTIANAVNNLS